MQQIEKFINELYADVEGKESLELREEMRSHLIESVEDLKAEGKTEEEAISIALNRFGDEKQISRGLISLFKSNNKLISNLSRISFASLIIGIIALLGLMWAEDVSETKQLIIDQTVSQISRIVADGNLTEQKIDEIFSLVEENKEIEIFKFYKNSNSKMAISIKEIEEEWEKVIDLGQSSYRGNSNYSWKQLKDPYEQWYFKVGYEKQMDLDKLFSIPLGLIIVFIILGVTSLILKININRKMLKAFLDEN